MRSKLFKWFFVVSFITSFQAPVAQSSEVLAQAKNYLSSCFYYTQTISELKLAYINQELPWGVKVFLVAGFEDSQGYQWKTTFTRELPATGAYTWETHLEWSSYSRGQPFFVGALNFVYKIELPDGKVVWDNGTLQPSSMGYYRVEALQAQELGRLPCVQISSSEMGWSPVLVGVNP